MSTKVDRTFVRRDNGNGQFVLTNGAISCTFKSFVASDANAASWGIGLTITGALAEDCSTTGCRSGFYIDNAKAPTRIINCDSYFCESAIVLDGAGTGYVINAAVPINTFTELWGPGNLTSSAVLNFSHTNVEYYGEFEFSGEMIYNFGSGYLTQNGGGQFTITFSNAVFSELQSCVNHYGETYLWKTTHDSFSIPFSGSLGSNVGLLHGNQLVDASSSTLVPSLYYNDRFKSAVLQRSTTLRRTASDYSWEHNVGSETLTYEQSSFPLANIACPANEARTVNVYARRANSEGIARIKIYGGRYNGVPTDLVSELTTTDSWELLSLTFTPTEDVVVTVFMESKYVSNNATRKLIYFDDLEVT